MQTHVLNKALKKQKSIKEKNALTDWTDVHVNELYK